MAFEVFERKSRRVKQPVIAITLSGKIWLNVIAAVEMKTARVGAVRVLWDPDTRTVALQGVDQEDKNAYLLYSDSGGSVSVGAKRFVRSLGLIQGERIVLPATWNATDRMLFASVPGQYFALNGGGSNRQDIATDAHLASGGRAE
ncbi:MAG: hypothetical protein WB992_25115 [Bryobacteraceae bacterium]